MMKRLFIFILFFLFSMSVVSADLITNNELYWTLDNVLTDATGNGNTLDNNGATNIPNGKINTAFSWDGIDDYMNLSFDYNQLSFSVSGWFNITDDGGGQFLFSLETDSQDKHALSITSTDLLQSQIRISGSPIRDDASYLGLYDDYHFLTWTYNVTGGDTRVYVDAALLFNYTSGTTPDDATQIGLGALVRSSPAIFTTGLIDEVSMWSRVLTPTEIIQLNNSGLGCQFDYAACTPIPVVTINSPANTSFFNTTSIPLNVSTNINTNLSYIFNGASEVALCTNCNSSTNITLIGVEGLNTLIVFSNFTGTITNASSQFTIDITFPIIFDSLDINQTAPFVKCNEEYNSYIFPTGNFICDTTPGPPNFIITTCLETNVDFCRLEFDGSNQTLPANNFSVGDSINFTSMFNGNVSYKIHAQDLAGNLVTKSGRIFINPINSFHFQNSSPILLTNLTFGGRSDANGVVNYTTYNDGLSLGINTLLFEKLGYVSENFSFTLNTTNQLNLTFNVSAASITVNLFNRLNGSPLLVSTLVNIFGLGNITTSTGQAVFQDFNFLPNDYEVEAIATGFYTEQQTFTYTGEANAIINLFLLDLSQNNTATLIVPTIDEWDNVLAGVDVRLQEYDASILGFKQVSQCISNSNGECQFLIEQSTKSYRLVGTAIINGITYTATNPLEANTGETFQPIISGGQEVLGLDIIRQLRLKISDELPPANFLGLTITAPFTAEQTILLTNDTATIINVPIDFFSTSGLSYTVCFDVFVTSGTRYTSVITPICTTGASGVLPTVNVTLNNDFDFEAVITVEFDGILETFRTYPYPNDKSFAQTLLNDALVPNAVMFFWTVLLAFSMYLRSVALWSWGAMFLAVVQLAMFPNLLVLSSSVIIIVLNGCVLYISKKQIDSV